jgi:hypothetical protein
MDSRKVNFKKQGRAAEKWIVTEQGNLRTSELQNYKRNIGKISLMWITE